MKQWKRYNPIGAEEKKAVQGVMDSGCLSSFIGGWGDGFHGGPQIKAFEKEISEYFNVKHAITFNSLTSGLIAAMGAIGICPGDEVIVSPWTMSATATAIIIWGGIPVFADIESDYYGLDPESVKKKITSKTKAVMVTDIFGHGACLDEIKALCDSHKLKLIEDVAQAPGITFKGKLCGKWGDIGGFSLNYHKHIHTGEGGFCICDDDDLALRMKMIRNHAEASVVNSPIKNLVNMIGYNFRLGEIEAAIGREQLKKLPKLLEKNRNKVKIINNILLQEKDFKLSVEEIDSEHAYYVIPIQIIEQFSLRSLWVAKLKEQGVPGLVEGYVNVHRLPMYEKKIAYGNNYPWCLSDSTHNYGSGLCPIAEHLKDHAFVGVLVSMFDLTNKDCEWIGDTLINTWRQLKV